MECDLSPPQPQFSLSAWPVIRRPQGWWGWQSHRAEDHGGEGSTEAPRLSVSIVKSTYLGWSRCFTCLGWAGLRGEGLYGPEEGRYRRHSQDLGRPSLPGCVVPTGHVSGQSFLPEGSWLGRKEPRLWDPREPRGQTLTRPFLAG